MSPGKKQLEENNKSRSWSLKKKLDNLATVSEEGDKELGSKSRSSNPIKSRSSSHQTLPNTIFKMNPLPLD
jgi:hypothetical protein